MRISLSVATLLTVFAMGCGASQWQAGMHPALRTDGDRYAASLGDAIDAYEAEVARAEGIAYPTPEGAESVAQVASPDRLDAHLDAALHARGLTPQGLSLYSLHHPAWLRQQRARYAARLSGLETRVRSDAFAAGESYAGDLLLEGRAALAQR